MEPAEEVEAADRLSRALEETGARDPRDYYRARLRELKSGNPEGYDRAVRHYREVVIPSIASARTEPLEAWLEYGRLIVSLAEEGRTVVIDPEGKAEPYDPPVPLDRMVLHLPDNARVKAIPVGLPARFTPAQQAGYDLLVAGRQSLRAAPEGVE